MDPEIDLITLNESHQTKSDPGTFGDDRIVSRIVAQTPGTPAEANGNTHSAAGGDGHDDISGEVTADASAGGTATASDNTSRMTGDADDDYLYVALRALADAGGAAAATGNSLILLGGTGSDYITADVAADARDASSASLTGNRLSLSGEDGNDVLQLNLISYREGTGATSLDGNRFALRGGTGDDYLSFGTGEGGNPALLNGGGGFDTAYIDYAQRTASLVVDFSKGYDATLADGVQLRGLERVAITAGTGDDVFIGGNAGDEFNADLGSDSVQGRGGDDSLTNFLWASATDGATAVHSGDVDGLSGDAGQDSLSVSATVFAIRGGDATVSGNTTTMDGGADNDNLSLSVGTETYQDGGDPGTASLRDNGFTLLGADGSDYLDGYLFSDASEGGTSTTTGNLVALRGGAQRDSAHLVVSASAWDYTGTGSTATTSDNNVLMTGDTGRDTLSVEIWGSADASGTASVIDNALTLNGGANNDRLFVGYDLGPTEGGTTTVAGNRFVLQGGSGNDSLGLVVLDLGDNQALLSGGRDSDRATVDYRLDEDLAFDFSGGYDHTLARNVALSGIERIWIVSGSGDDEFTGGSGNDRFEGNAGDDTAYLDGDRSDYRVRVLESGYVRITDLRDGSPDGTDLYSGVEHFVFAGQEVAIA